jgi:uncharacterized membrane protein YhaH (DUF805 family)
MNTYLSVLKQYADFKGRARRREFWTFTLVNVAIGVLLNMLAMVPGLEIISMIVYAVFALALLIPSLAVSFRRMHDTGRSAWWLLISLVPFVGAIVLLVFYLLDSQPGDNKYGPNPKGVGVVAPAAVS